MEDIMYWEKEKECMKREDLEQLQLERLESTLTRVQMNVPFYRKKFDETGIDTDNISSVEELRKLPFTTKEDLRENYPYGLFAVPLREVVRVHASSGTTGSSTVVGYTQNDIRTWANLTARVLTAGGVTKDDVVQISFGYGLFTGGFGLHYGAERLGASVIPMSSGNTARQIKIMQDFKSTALICTPSYALLIADTVYDMGININTLSLKFGLFGAEPWSDGMRKEIQEKLKITATDNYGLSEVMGTLEPVADGEIGELVITTLTKEAFPVIRYRTRDLTRIISEPCPCGRTFKRMQKVMGRDDDMLIVKGVNVFPSQIESVLFNIEGTEPHYQIILDRKDAMDEMTVLVEVAESIFFDEVKEQSNLIELIKKSLATELGIGVHVKLVEKKTLERFEGKSRRVVDNRKI
jgi:phenylacetate-CoA ligase